MYQGPASAFFVVTNQNHRLLRFDLAQLHKLRAFSGGGNEDGSGNLVQERGGVMQPFASIGKKGRSEARLQPNGTGNRGAVRSAHAQKEDGPGRESNLSQL